MVTAIFQRRFCLLRIVSAALAASVVYADSSYSVNLEPNTAKRRSVVILRDQGPETATLSLYAPDHWAIGNSRITMQDDCLWQAHSTPRGGGVHVYRMVNAHSSQQYVEITGNLVRPGAQGVPPWFRTTVPSVDVDWSEHSGHGDEADEDSWVGLCPVTANRNEMTRLVVCRPNDDLTLVSGDMVLECEPTTRVRFLRESGSGILWSGATVNYSMTPLSLLVDPQQPGDFSVTLKGQTDEKNKCPTDYLKGRAVVIDLDVDVDGNGTITDADDPSEETIGGYVGVSTDNLTPIKLKLLPTTGTDWKLRLLAPEGGSHIRVWTTANRTGAVSLPKTWAPGDTIPSTLYVEGVTPSSNLRDVALRLEYDLNPVGQNAENRKLADIVRLTVVSAGILRPQGSLSANPNPVTSWLSTPCYHFDFQGVVSGTPGFYLLNIEGVVAPTPHLSYRWTLDNEAGALQNETTATPLVVPPSSEGAGWLCLKAVESQNGNEVRFNDKRRIRVYADHLERDRTNFGVGISCRNVWSFTAFGTTITMANTWNCHGSVLHAYSGLGNGFSDNTVSWSTTEFTSPINWSAVTALLARGDVVSFYSGKPGKYKLQHSHTCLGNAIMYGANNEPVADFNSLIPATWKWDECTSEQYFNAVNASSRAIFGSDFLTRILVHKKP